MTVNLRNNKTNVWSNVKKEVGVSRTIFRQHALFALEASDIANPGWAPSYAYTEHDLKNQETAVTNQAKPTAAAFKFSTMGLLCNTTKFIEYSKMFDEFRIAACIYTITLGGRYSAERQQAVDINYWPNSASTIITAFDRLSRNTEEYMSIITNYTKPEDHDPEKPIPLIYENLNTMLSRIYSEPSCRIRTVAGGNQCQQIVSITPIAGISQHKNWTSTRFYNKKIEGAIPTFPFLNNQIFNPTVIAAVSTDNLNGKSCPFIVSLDVEIRLEYRGANMGGVKIE